MWPAAPMAALAGVVPPPPGLPEAPAPAVTWLSSSASSAPFTARTPYADLSPPPLLACKVTS